MNTTFTFAYGVNSKTPSVKLKKVNRIPNLFLKYVGDDRLLFLNLNRTKTILLFLLFIGSRLFAQPDAPTGFYIISQNMSNELFWTASAGTDDYYIYRSKDSITFNIIDTVSDPTTIYTDNNLINGEFYFYKVTAYNSGTGESDFSNTDASTPDEDDISKYMHFDGDENYVVVSDTAKLMSMPYNVGTTLECWVRFDTLPSERVYIPSRELNCDRNQ
jgi:hypothetical protein